jgi:hypothetical protein
MKRIKIAQNRFLSLYQTLTNYGQIAQFEIARSTSHPNPLITVFNANAYPIAQHAFELLTNARTLIGPSLSRQSMLRILTGQALFGPVRRKAAKAKKRAKKRSNPTIT